MRYNTDNGTVRYQIFEAIHTLKGQEVSLGKIMLTSEDLTLWFLIHCLDIRVSNNTVCYSM